MTEDKKELIKKQNIPSSASPEFTGNQILDAKIIDAIKMDERIR